MLLCFQEFPQISSVWSSLANSLRMDVLSLTTTFRKVTAALCKSVFYYFKSINCKRIVCEMLKWRGFSVVLSLDVTTSAWHQFVWTIPQNPLCIWFCVCVEASSSLLSGCWPRSTTATRWSAASRFLKKKSLSSYLFKSIGVQCCCYLLWSNRVWLKHFKLHPKLCGLIKWWTSQIKKVDE